MIRWFKYFVLAIAIAFCATPATASQATDPYGIERILSWKDPRVSVIVDWEKCGQVNAWYSPHRKHIVMCTELIQYKPFAIPFFFAHELGHATIEQLDLPFTGSEETAADEFAAYTLIGHGMKADVISVAQMWWEEHRDLPYYDPHPDDDDRAWALVVFVVGHDDPDDSDEYTRLVHTWSRYLARSK